MALIASPTLLLASSSAPSPSHAAPPLLEQSIGLRRRSICACSSSPRVLKTSCDTMSERSMCARGDSILYRTSRLRYGSWSRMLPLSLPALVEDGGVRPLPEGGRLLGVANSPSNASSSPAARTSMDTLTEARRGFFMALAKESLDSLRTPDPWLRPDAPFSAGLVFILPWGVLGIACWGLDCLRFLLDPPKKMGSWSSDGFLWTGSRAVALTGVVWSSGVTTFRLTGRA
mmetsp:Transcript_44418/g.141412  ORF Transcript_44418/g.141412 Transcript_44418/m.141412 type:complete len:230 (+) Transcript_44418:626-1315(+)